MANRPGTPSTVLLVCSLGLVCTAAAGFGQTGFWNVKEPATYSDEEKSQILSDSPWSKIAHSKQPDADSAGSTGYFGPSGAGDRRQAPRNLSKPASPSSKEALKDLLAFYGPVTVRWESAPLIREV